MSLLDAVRDRDIAMVLKTYQTQWGGRDEHGFTALHLAVKNSFFRAILVLRTYEARLRLANGRTALMEAITQRSMNSVILLKGYEKRCQDKNGKTALMIAASMGYCDAVNLLGSLESGLSDTSGLTALMHAALADSAPCVKILINYEAGRVDFQGKSALIYAVLYNCPTVVPLLIAAEAGLQDCKGNTAFIYACRVNSVALVTQLYDLEKDVLNAKRQTGLMNAVIAHSIDVVSFLIEQEKKYYSGNNQRIGMDRQPKRHVRQIFHWFIFAPLRRLATNLVREKSVSLTLTFMVIFWNKISLFFTLCMHLVDVLLLQNFPKIMFAFVAFTGLGNYILLVLQKVRLFFVLLKDDIRSFLWGRMDIQLGMEQQSLIEHGKYCSSDCGRTTDALNKRDLACATQLGKQDTLGFTALMHACRQGNMHIVKTLIPYEAGMQSLAGDSALAIALRNMDEVPLPLIESEAHLCDSGMKRPCEVAYEVSNDVVGKLLVDKLTQCMTRRDYRTTLCRSFLSIEERFEAIIAEEKLTDALAEDVLLIKECLYNTVFNPPCSWDDSIDIDRVLNLLDALFEKDPCFICLNNLATAVALPCAHFVMCEACITKLSRCPLCMADINDKLIL